MADLKLAKFPFFKEGMDILDWHALSIQKIDEETTFDDLLKDVINDIIDAFKENKITPINKIQNDNYEVVKFYLTLYVLKSMPSLMMFRYWFKAYMFRYEFIIKQISNIKQFSTIVANCDMPHVFLRIQGVDFMAIKINDYMDIAVNIKENDKRFKLLLPINQGVEKGRVFLPVDDIGLLKLLCIKLTEIKIVKLLDKLDLVVRSKKVDNIISQLQTYLANDPTIQSKSKQLEYGETTPEIEIQNDKMVEMFKSKPGFITIKQMPPCINHILNKILKKEILSHPENILLATYLATKGFKADQMVDIFMAAVNADKGKITYNLAYVLDRKMKPYNCTKVVEFNCCYKDEVCERLNLVSPLGYRK